MKNIYIPNRSKNATVDDEDYNRLIQFSWHISERGHITRTVNFVDSFGKRGVTHIAMANEVMNRFGVKFDHIDRDGRNNQKQNLREATSSQNNFNTTKQKGTSSKYKGVTWSKRHRKWFVTIQCNKKRLFLGLFKNEDEAGRAYDTKAVELFKEFANLNFK